MQDITTTERLFPSVFSNVNENIFWDHMRVIRHSHDQVIYDKIPIVMTRPLAGKLL